MKMKRAHLVFKEADFQALREHLLQPDRMERAAFLLLGKAEVDDTLELYVHRLICPQDHDYYEQHRAVVEPTPQSILKTFAQFAQSDVPGYLHAHSHPFSAIARFSPVDDRYLPGTRQSLHNYLWLTQSRNEFIFVRLVYGRREEGFSAECFDRDGNPLAEVEGIKVVGPHGIRRVQRGARDQMSHFHLRPKGGDLIRRRAEVERFDRNIRWLGEEGQRRILQTHLVICGVGGLGGFVVTQAKGLGFRKITLIDPDRVEASNLNRLAGATWRDIGRPKVEVMARELRRYDRDIEVQLLYTKVQDKAAHRAILKGDIIVSCVDNDAARLEIQVLAARYLKPLLDLGSGILLEGKKVEEIGGQAIFYIPGGPCLLCQGLDPAKIVSDEIREVQRAVGYVVGTDETPPSVVTLDSVIAGLGMDLLTRYLTGFARVPTYLRYDLLENAATELNFTKRPGCPICGEEGIEGKGDEMEKVLERPITITNAASWDGARNKRDGVAERFQHVKRFLSMRDMKKSREGEQDAPSP